VQVFQPLTLNQPVPIPFTSPCGLEFRVGNWGVGFLFQPLTLNQPVPIPFTSPCGLQVGVGSWGVGFLSQPLTLNQPVPIPFTSPCELRRAASVSPGFGTSPPPPPHRTASANCHQLNQQQCYVLVHLRLTPLLHFDLSPIQMHPCNSSFVYMYAMQPRTVHSSQHTAFRSWGVTV
jgi:hypothetical protein